MRLARISQEKKHPAVEDSYQEQIMRIKTQVTSSPEQFGQIVWLEALNFFFFKWVPILQQSSAENRDISCNNANSTAFWLPVFSLHEHLTSVESNARHQPSKPVNFVPDVLFTLHAIILCAHQSGILCIIARFCLSNEAIVLLRPVPVFIIANKDRGPV